MSTTGNRVPRRALIVGAGIAGLATALRLRRSDWDIVLVERASSMRGGGYMIGFSGIGYRAASQLGLLPALRELQPPATDLLYVDQAGRQQAVMPVEAQQAMLGEEMLALLRGDLETTLFQALQACGDGGSGSGWATGVDIRFATTVADIDQDADGVTATLSDGRQERVDLLVGADGLHSAVRDLVFGPEKAYRVDFGHAVATYLLDKAPDGVALGSTVSMDLVGRGVSVYTVRGGRSAAFFTFSSDQLDADLQAGAGPTLRRVFGDLGWVVPELLRGLQSNPSVYFDRISQIAMDTWSAGRVVLVGDSAWCVSLFAGYGASLAVAGADLLGTLLDENPDLPTALRMWEARLRPEMAKKQRQGRRARRLFVAPNRIVHQLRLLTFRLVGSRLVLGLMRRFLGLDKPRHEQHTAQ
jgi:2-polyprenyl-6-methoxyphenol hydroxylase-like FAD-dependent oxidoreductase